MAYQPLQLSTRGESMEFAASGNKNCVQLIDIVSLTQYCWFNADHTMNTRRLKVKPGVPTCSKHGL